MHPNTVRIEIRGKSREAEISGSSIGGGVIEVFKINGFQTRFKGDSPTLLLFYRDRAGMISEVTKIIAEEGINIASLSCSRKQRGKDAFMQIDVDSPMSDAALQRIRDTRMWMRRGIWIGFRSMPQRSELAAAESIRRRSLRYASTMIESFPHLEQLAAGPRPCGCFSGE